MYVHGESSIFRIHKMLSSNVPDIVPEAIFIVLFDIRPLPELFIYFQNYSRPCTTEKLLFQIQIQELCTDWEGGMQSCKIKIIKYNTTKVTSLVFGNVRSIKNRCLSSNVWSESQKFIPPPL